METLDKLTLRGFKSIKDATIELRPLNVLIGANGSGKSNLISFFKMLNEMANGRLQQYIAVSGRAHSLLYHGPKTTPQVEMVLEFRKHDRTFRHSSTFSYAAGDTLIRAKFGCEADKGDDPSPPPGFVMRQFPIEIDESTDEYKSRREAFLADSTREWLEFIENHLAEYRVYHFQDMAANARVRQYCYVGDNRHLMPDAGNLAAILHRLRNEDAPAYRRIVGVVRLIAPYFDDFDLVPEGRDIILNWRERGSDQLFGPHQLSDGTLRAICLATLLLQPEGDQPNLIVVDEPELGLHPYALNIVADLFQKAAKHKQVLISTQSSAFLDEFEPEDVIVVDRGEQGSTFTRLDPESLEAWLEEYSLGEIWEKNVVGGGPH
ncbi:MAG: chromosome segregation protein SMC [Planctomycetales bacterium 71-10]|nr:MAG: chromosome segregation protein SMC [Planctomycetales bacterium 71-10]